MVRAVARRVSSWSHQRMAARDDPAFSEGDLLAYLAHQVPIGGDQRRGDEFRTYVALAEGFLVKRRHSCEVRSKPIPRSGTACETGIAYLKGPHEKRRKLPRVGTLPESRERLVTQVTRFVDLYRVI